MTPAPENRPSAGASTRRIGFACAWDPVPERTWSYTPFNMRAALRARADIKDIGIRLPTPVRKALTALYAKRHQGTWVSSWKHARLWEVICQTELGSRAVAQDCGAVLEIQDLASFDRPFFIYQDMSYDILFHRFEKAMPIPHFPMLDMDALKRLRERQSRMYERASGVLAMSHWFADNLVELSGLPKSKVHVVQPGRNVVGGEQPAGIEERRAMRYMTGPQRLLFVGRDFFAKGGDQVVASVALLRRSYAREVTLTVAGPKRWPLEGHPPHGVDFVGPVAPAQVANLMGSHDLLVMPARFEAFGIVFVEALAFGLPCIGRDDFAMPELIRSGHNGALVNTNDPSELADAIVAVLEDDELRARCWTGASEVRGYYSWGRAASQVMEAIDTSLQLNA